MKNGVKVLPTSRVPVVPRMKLFAGIAAGILGNVVMFAVLFEPRLQTGPIVWVAVSMIMFFLASAGLLLLDNGKRPIPFYLRWLGVIALLSIVGFLGSMVWLLVWFQITS